MVYTSRNIKRTSDRYEEDIKRTAVADTALPYTNRRNSSTYCTKFIVYSKVGTAPFNQLLRIGTESLSISLSNFLLEISTIRNKHFIRNARSQDPFHVSIRSCVIQMIVKNLYRYITIVFFSKSFEQLQSTFFHVLFGSLLQEVEQRLIVSA